MTNTTSAARKSAKSTTKAAESTLYKIHSLDAIEIDTRLRRVAALNEDEARELTTEIKRTSVRLWLLVTEAHDRKAHLALGYETWADYVKAELNISESRSYQFLDTGHVMKALASAGVDVEKQPPPPTRVVARVKDRLSEVQRVAKKAVKESVNGEHVEVVDQAIRQLAKEQRKLRIPGKVTVPAPAKKGSAPTAARVAAAVSAVEPELTTCPACGGSGQVDRSTAERLKDWIAKIRSS